MFQEFGPPAEKSGARLLTAMGYDFAPGAFAGALALEEAGAEAVRVDVGYYALGGGPSSLSAGTRESLVGVTLDDGHAYRDGRVRSVRSAERVRSFRVAGKSREAISVGGAEHFGLPASYPGLREVNVYLGWFGPLARPLQAGSLVGSFVRRIPLTTTAIGSPASAPLGLVSGPEPGTTPGGRSWIAAEAYDGAGRTPVGGAPRGRRRVRVHRRLHGLGGAAADHRGGRARAGPRRSGSSALEAGAAAAGPGPRPLAPANVDFHNLWL